MGKQKTGKKKKVIEKVRGEPDAAEQDGQKLGKKKKVAEQARGEPDAAEQDVCDHDWDLEDPFYLLQRLKSLKTKSSVTDAKPQQQKTGKKKKDTENARGEPDAAEQDGQKMEKKKNTEKKKKKVTEKAR